MPLGVAYLVEIDLEVKGDLPGQMGKVDAALRAMDKGLGDKPFCSGVHLSLSDVATGCALAYLDLRFAHIDWRARHPNLARLQDKLSQRPSFIETAPA